MNTSKAKHQHIFIAGLHRSGTTLLSRCLQEHPQISGFENTGVYEDEGQFLQSVYPIAGVYGGPGRFGFNSDSFLDEYSQLATPENRVKIFEEWSQYWNLEKTYLLEKSPPNLVRTRFLQYLFPEAIFIVLLRHPIAVSYATQKWSKTPLHALIKHWLVCHERFMIDRSHLKKVLVLKYEDFINNPELILNQIYDFIGVESYPLNRVIHQGVNDRYFAWWNHHKNLLKPVYKAYISSRFEAKVNQFDYSLYY
ncbi:MAG: sulfotransferase [Microcoleaceae cyanobacterium]